MYRFMYIVGGICIGIVLSYLVFFSDLFTFQTLQESADRLQAAVARSYSKSVIGFVSAYTLGVTFSAPVASFATLAGGVMFGPWYGGLYSVIGATLGAIGNFLLVRYFLRNPIQQHYAQKLHIFNHEAEHYGMYYLLALRFFSVIPFFMINSIAGLSVISFEEFVLSTAIGIVPGSFVYAYAGSQLAELKSPADILTPPVMLAFAALGVLALLPILYKKHTSSV